MSPRWPVHDPADLVRKVLRACQSLKMEISPRLFGCKNYTTQDRKDPCLKSSLAQKFFVSEGIRRGTTFEFEHLREFKTKLENNSWYESGLHLGSTYKKNRGQKSRVSFSLKPVGVRWSKHTN
jgi:hypothetical protein